MALYWLFKMLVSHSLTGMYIEGTEIPGTRVFSGMPSEPKKDHPHSSLMLCVISSSVGFLKWSCPSEPSVSVVNTTMSRICLDDFGLPHVPPKKIRLLEKSPGPPFIPAATFARPSADINAKKIPAPGRVNYRPARKYPMKNQKRLEPTRRGETWHGATTGTLTDHGTTWCNLFSAMVSRSIAGPGRSAKPIATHGGLVPAGTRNMLALEP